MWCWTEMSQKTAVQFLFITVVSKYILQSGKPARANLLCINNTVLKFKFETLTEKKTKKKKIGVNNNNNIDIIRFLDNLSIQVSFFDIRSFIITISSQKTSSSVFHSFIRSKWNRFGRSHRVPRAHWAFSSYSSVTQPTAASQSVWLLPHTELWPRRRSRR